MVPLAPMQLDRPPGYRLTDPIKARSIVVNLWQAAQERNLKNAAIQGQLDGNPPYNPKLMRQAGRAGDANFNTLTGKAICSQALTPYYDLFTGGNRYIEVAMDYPGIGDADWQSQYVADVVAEEYDGMLRRWRNFEYVINSVLRDFIAFGKGYIHWRPNGNWRFTKVAHYRLFVPDATPVDVDELELYVVWQNWPVTFLMDAIRDPAAAEAGGWSIIETKKAMMAAVPIDPSVPNDPILAQAQLRDSDIYVSARNATVQLATLFVKEFGGKWSELIVRRDQIPALATAIAPSTAPAYEPDPTNQSGFIYAAYDKHDCIQESMIPFFFESAEANWNGCSGLGRDIFSYAQLKDRSECSKFDSLFLRNSIILQPKTEADRQNLQLMQLGRMTVLPPNFDVHPGTTLGDISSSIEIGASIDRQMEQNTGIYRPTLEKGGGNPSTLGQFQTEFAQATVLSTSAINRFYSQLDRLYEEQFKRVIQMGRNADGDAEDGGKDADWSSTVTNDPDNIGMEARCFVARCQRRGVSLDDLRHHVRYIRAFRAIGNGSAAMRQQMVSAFMAPTVFPYFPPDGQSNILEDFTRTLGGQTAVRRYLPASARLQQPTDQQAMATLENGSLKDGNGVLWTPSQQNIVHAHVHLTAASQAAASIQRGGDPHQVLAFLESVGPHIHEHLIHEQSKPGSTGAVKQLDAQTKRLASFADGLRKHLQQQAQQQAQLQQRSQQQLTEAQLQQQKIQLDSQNSHMKAAGMLQLRKQRQDAELALKAQAQSGQTQLADAQTAATIHQSTAKTAADIAHKDAKTAADIQHARAETFTGIQHERAQTMATIAHGHAKTVAEIEATRAKAEAAAKAAAAKPAAGA